MVNARTLRGLRAALLDCVPGRAQRRRLLEALSRVPGNKAVSEAITWLIAREEDSPSQRASAGRIPSPPKSGVFRTQVIAYSQAAAEVQVTMSRDMAEVLRRALETAGTFARPDESKAALELHDSILKALEAKHG